MMVSELSLWARKTRLVHLLIFWSLSKVEFIHGGSNAAHIGLRVIIPHLRQGLTTQMMLQ